MSEREAQVYQAAIAGETDAEIGARFDLPRARVRDIVTRERAKAQRDREESERTR